VHRLLNTPKYLGIVEDVVKVELVKDLTMSKVEMKQNINYFDHGYKNNLVCNMGEILEPKECRISKIRKLFSINHH